MTPACFCRAAALVLLLCSSARANDAEYFTISKTPIIDPAGATHYLLSVNTPEFSDANPIFVVRRDGTVLVKGQPIEQLNTAEAREAMLAVTKALARTNDNSTEKYLSRQTETLLLQLDACMKRCGQ